MVVFSLFRTSNQIKSLAQMIHTMCSHILDAPVSIRSIRMDAIFSEIVWATIYAVLLGLWPFSSHLHILKRQWIVAEIFFSIKISLTLTQMLSYRFSMWKLFFSFSTHRLNCHKSLRLIISYIRITFLSIFNSFLPPLILF